MTAAEIIAKLKSMEPELRAAGVGALYLFGSRARGDHRPDSDVDLAFEAPAGDLDLWTRAEIMARVANGADIGIDLVNRATLRPPMRASIERDMRRVF